MVKVFCDWCKKEYKVYPSQLKKAKKHFCSKSCQYEWNKTIEGYWKGKKIPFYKRPNRDVRGAKNTRWKGGRRIDKDGYVLIWNPQHPYSDYCGYVREHRLVIEKKIGRFLQPTEVVHHKDGNKLNNNVDNLEVYKNVSEHQKYHYPTARQIKYSPAWKKEHPSIS